MVISLKNNCLVILLRKKENDEFLYKIANMDFSISEIRDGLLRENKKCTNFKGFSPSDPKFALIQVFL